MGQLITVKDCISQASMEIGIAQKPVLHHFRIAAQQFAAGKGGEHGGIRNDKPRLMK